MVLLLLTAIGGVPAVAAENNQWTGRSGEAEVLADIAKGRPVKLILKGIAGERLDRRTPGLSNCNPDRYDVPNELQSQFEPLGADYSESVQYTAEELARLRSATMFARDYNRTNVQGQTRRRSQDLSDWARPDHP